MWPQRKGGAECCNFTPSLCPTHEVNQSPENPHLRGYSHRGALAVVIVRDRFATARERGHQGARCEGARRRTAPAVEEVASADLALYKNVAYRCDGGGVDHWLVQYSSARPIIINLTYAKCICMYNKIAIVRSGFDISRLKSARAALWRGCTLWPCGQEDPL
jgi:hypothetical protein